MNILRCVGLCVVLVCMRCEAQAQGAAREAAQGDSPLSAQVTVALRLGDNVAQAILVNKSSEFLCVSERVFDSQLPYVLFKRKDGSLVRPKSIAEPAIKIFLGFDYTDTYFFVMPGEKKSIAFDLSNFVLQPGRYDYEMTFTYYRCTDVIDSARIKARRKIPSFGIHATGEVNISKEEQ